MTRILPFLLIACISEVQQHHNVPRRCFQRDP